MIKIITLCLCCFFNICFSQLNSPSDKKLDSLFSFIDKNEPGVSVGVVKDGELIYSNQRGIANLEYDVSINKQTVFGLASVTKQMTAACIGVLENRGMLSVTDDVRKYIPELPDYGHAIRIKHLLNHTSGLRNHNVLLNLQGFDYEHSGYTNKSIQKLIFSQKGVNNKPGEKMLYSNSNYVLLALIIERVSGNSIHEFAKKELFEPLGMHHTFYKKSLEQIIKNRAYSYYKNKDEYKQPKSLTHCIGAGGVGSTIDNMVKWSNLFVNTKTKLSYLSEFITTLDTLNNGSKMKFARGVIVSPYKSQRTINHSGRDLGMRSQLICLPEVNLSVIMFSNSEHINVVNLSYKVIDLFLKTDKAITDEDVNYSHTKNELLNFSGDYQEMNSDLGMKIFVENDTLKAKSSYGNQPVPLKKISKNKFQRLNNPSVGYQFFNHKNKECDLAIDFGGAKFYFESVKLDAQENVNLNNYEGTYFSKELNVTYHLYVEQQKLFLSFPSNPKVELILGQKNEFGSRNRTRYIFKQDKNQLINSFTVASEGTVKDILFQKIK